MSSSNGSITAAGSCNSRGGYSAAVRLILRLNGEQISVAQVGTDRLYLSTPTLLPSGAAELVVEVDGEQELTAIHIEEHSEPVQVIRYRAV